MKTGQRSRSKLFYRYLFSYILVFFLPLVVAGSFMARYFQTTYQSEIIGNTNEMLEQTAVSVDTQLKRIKSISENIFSNPQFYPFNLEDDTPTGIAVQKELQKYLSADDSFIEDVLFYSGKGNYLHSPSTSYRIDNYFYTHHYENWDAETFREDIRSLRSVVIRPEEQVCFFERTDTVVTFIYPDNNPYMNRCLIFSVRASSFYQMLQGSVQDLNVVASFQNADGEQIVGFSSYDQIEDGLSFEGLETGDRIRINGKSHLYLCEESASTHWKYIVAADSANVLAPIRRVQALMVIGGALLTLLGSLLAFFYSRRNYAPVRQLRDTLPLPEEETGDEFDMIQLAVKSIKSSNNALSAELERAAPARRDYLFYNLVKGAFPTLEKFNEEGDQCGFTFADNRFRIAIFYNKDWNTIPLENVRKASSSLTGLFPAEVRAYCRGYIDGTSLMMILSFPEDFPEETQRSLLEQCRTLLEREFGYPPSAGVSETGAMDQIPKLYLQAQTAVDYRLVQGLGGTIWYQSIALKDLQGDPVFQNLDRKLEQLLLNGESEQIENLLFNIVRYIKSSNMTIILVKFVCFDIIHAVMRVTEEIGAEDRDFLSEIPNVFAISAYETIDELVAVVEKLGRSIRNHLQKRTAHQPQELSDQMVSYLKSNYSSVDFSLQTMAEVFDMSPPNLSTYFKKKTGQTILNYLTALRIEKAKELLSGSNMSLHDIALEVGYYSFTSFMRRFKQYAGITPGEYRKNSRYPNL
ncbi:MAG: AraC family transcriptional regulator [Oscillospiraceae bacterium]|nr:AraC family transcriptional regulator [Oscillospiraceae bacterium]